MDWPLYAILCVLCTAGYTAAVYKKIAVQNRWPIGKWFSDDGVATISGGFLVLATLVISAFVNPWWSCAGVFVIGWLASQVTVALFGHRAQIIALIFGTVSVLLLAIKMAAKYVQG